MTPRLRGRRRDATRLLEELTRWARQEPDVVALAVVGSYARGDERMASDVDVLVVRADRGRFPEGSGWFTRIRSRSRLVREQDWGPVREQRYRLRSGLVVEIDVAPPSWAQVPLDAGTRRVLADGHRVLHDPDGVLAEAGRALPPPRPRRPAADRDDQPRTAVISRRGPR